jgi:hypothetical protein
MKKLITILLLLPLLSTAQSCVWGGGKSGGGEPAKITANVQVDNSFKYYQPSGFSGIGIHAGVWFGNLGLTLGGTDTRRDYSVYARRDLVVSIMQRVLLFEERLQLMPFFSAGTNSYSDLGFRAGWKVYDGIYVGGMTSVNMKYGLSVSVSVNH